MGIWGWLAENWFNVFGSAGIAGLWLAAIALRGEAKARRNTNLLTITTSRWEIWREYLHNPKLDRILEATADTGSQPVTAAERIFVTSVILHASGTYHAMKDQLVIELEGMRRDIAQFLSLPVPREVWKRIRPLQNADFVAFVENSK